ncbi:DUF6476 family protein [Paracoccaceae bacterium]
MSDTPDADRLPPSLRFLKALVIILMITMIAGLIAVVTLLVTRLPDPNAAPRLPEGLALPEGAVPAAVTLGTGWIAVVTEDDRILIFLTADGRLLQEVKVDLPKAP